MKKYGSILLIIFAIFCSCSDGAAPAGPSATGKRTPVLDTDLLGETPHYFTCRGITLLPTLPKGGGYTDPAGRNLGYRIFRTRIINDTIVPIGLMLDLPGDSVPVQPGFQRSFRLFLFPEVLTSDQLAYEYNFGIRDVKSYLDTALHKPSGMKITLQPGEDQVLYFGTVFSAPGAARAKLFVRDPASSGAKDQVDLLLDLDLPFSDTLISCGQVVFKPSGNSPD